MMTAMKAGKREKSAHIIVRTDSVTEAGSMLSLPISSDIIVAPAMPRRRAMSEPETAPPNFYAMVPDEKMRPVDDVPKVSVA